jgi:hypothetical protein
MAALTAFQALGAAHHARRFLAEIDPGGRTARATATAFGHRNKVTQPEPARRVG